LRRHEADHHLVQRTERLALEAHALGGTGKAHDRRHPAHLDVTQAGLGERGFKHAVGAERERPGLPRPRRRQPGALAKPLRSGALYTGRDNGAQSQASLKWSGCREHRRRRAVHPVQLLDWPDRDRAGRFAT
jgi:hypothetical protein